MINAITDPWFWGTDSWLDYCREYGRGFYHNFGTGGNLVVRLGAEREMLQRLRKGHRADITKAKRTLDAIIGFGDERFNAYMDLHRLQHGNVRSDRTYEIQREWCRDGNAVVALALHLAVPMGAALFICFQRGAYYASAAQRPERKDAIGHVLVWSAMLYLAKHGYKWLDLGPMPGADATEKELAVYHFKRGFGGTVRTWPYD